MTNAPLLPKLHTCSRLSPPWNLRKLSPPWELSPTLSSRPSRTRPPAPRCYGPTRLRCPWQPRRYQARRHHPLLPGSLSLFWRSRLCPRLADPRQCRVYCRGRYQPQSLLRCQHLLHRASTACPSSMTWCSRRQRTCTCAAWRSSAASSASASSQRTCRRSSRCPRRRNCPRPSRRRRRRLRCPRRGLSRSRPTQPTAEPSHTPS